MQIHRIGDVTVLNTYTEIPGLGFLPVNAYVRHAESKVNERRHIERSILLA